MRIEPLTDEQAAAIAGWRYDFPYEWYDTSADPRRVELFTDPERREHLRAVVDDDGELIGFFNFVPEGREVRIGLGMRPNLTGRGLAQPFIKAGLDYARREWRPRTFRLWVARWNERALRAYRRAGFREVEHGEESRFVEMERPAQGRTAGGRTRAGGRRAAAGVVWVGTAPPGDEAYRRTVDVLRAIGLEAGFEREATAELGPEGGRVQVFAPGHPYHAFFAVEAQGPVPLVEVADLEAAVERAAAAGAEPVGGPDEDGAWRWQHLRLPDGGLWAVAERR